MILQSLFINSGMCCIEVVCGSARNNTSHPFATSGDSLTSV
jgi:hypothetical protein